MIFEVVIVGCGVAGLGAAIALTNKGHKVTILEATCILRPIGATIVFQANANRCLDHLGLYKLLLPFCNPISHGPSTRRYDTGELLANKPSETHEKTYGYPQWPFHRADVQQALVEAVKERDISLRLGSPVVAIEEGCRRVSVVLSNGERIEADVVVGADGIDSAVRKHICPDSACLKDSGMDVTRATIPADIVSSDPEISGFMDNVGLWCGPGATMAAMAVRRGNEVLLGLDCCHTRLNDRAQSKSRTQDIAQLKDHYRDFGPAVQKILLCVREAHVWKLKESLPFSWTSESGRIVLIGDAAHGSLPWVGQGAGMALEDAVSLAECLERANKPDDIPATLKAFQDIRQPRCTRVQEWSAEKGRRATLQNGEEQCRRDRDLRLANAWVKSAPWDGSHIDEVPQLGDPNWKAWLCGHDAVGYANRQLDLRFRQPQRRQGACSVM